MKINFLTIAFIFCCASNAKSQTRHCGTTEYFDMIKKQDPSVETRSQQTEIDLQKWIKENPAQSNDFSTIVTWPQIEGFTPTGNEEIDRLNYATAKKQMALLTTSEKKHSTEERKILQDKKRKENSMHIK